MQWVESQMTTAKENGTYEIIQWIDLAFASHGSAII
jgi:hypothetical protein